MKQKWTDLINNVLSNIICQIIFILFTAIGTPIVSAITLMKKGTGQYLDTTWWIIFATFILLSVINIIAAILHFINIKTNPSFPTIKSEVSYSFIRTELFFSDREHIKCNRDVNFKVLLDKMRFIRKQFTWTGDGYKGTTLDAKSIAKNYKIDDTIRRLPPQIYDIEFDCEKKKGEHVSYRITSEVEDNSHVMQPFLSQQINQETKKLNLVLTVPMGLVKNVKQIIYADSACKIKIAEPCSITPITYGNMETYEINIKRPKLLHIYRIEWEW